MKWSQRQMGFMGGCFYLIAQISINTTINTGLQGSVLIRKTMTDADESELIFNQEHRKTFALSSCTHTCTQSQSHLAHITKRADNRSWAQCGRVECVVRPSTQMSMFHFGEWRERSAWRRGRGEEFGRLRKSRRECCWSVSGREKVRLEMTEGKKERQAACVFMLCRD